MLLYPLVSTGARSNYYPDFVLSSWLLINISTGLCEFDPGSGQEMVQYPMYWTDPYPRPDLSGALHKTKNSHFLKMDCEES